MNYAIQIRSAVDATLGIVPFTTKIVWWNTGLYPLQHRISSGAGSAKDKKAVLERNKLILDLADENDILVVGEYKDEFGLKGQLTGKNSLNKIQGKPKRLDLVNLNYQSGKRMSFHNMIVYDSSRFSWEPRSILSCTRDNVGTRKDVERYRAYQVVKFRSIEDLTFAFELFVVHWGMRDGFGGSHARQLRLRSADFLKKRTRCDNCFPYKIVVGDFNNEPFEDGLFWLEGSRSKDYVRECGGLYNPFWRYLGAEKFTMKSPRSKEFLSHGAVFDNILVNKIFLDETAGWRITPEILEGRYDLRNCDHNPVRITFER